MFFPDDAVRVAALSSSVEGAPGYSRFEILTGQR